MRLQSRPDRQLLDPTRPGDPASYGPPADVEMTITPDRDCNVANGAQTGTVASPLVRTILNANWGTGLTFTVNAVQDPYDEDLRDESVAHVCELRYRFDSLDPIYDATEDAYQVRVLDDDVAGVNIDPAGPSQIAAEGGEGWTYLVSLDTPPNPSKPPAPTRGPTGVVLTPSPSCSVGAGAGQPITLSFTADNFDDSQPVHVVPVDNPVVELLHPCTVTTTIDSPDPVYANLDDPPAFAGTPATISGQIQDYAPPTITNDPPFVLVTTGGASIAEGSSQAWSVVLERAPLGSNVVVSFATVDDPVIGPQATLSAGAGAPGPSTSVTFTPANWNVPQQIQVAAVDDAYDEDDTRPWQVQATMASSAPGFANAALRGFVVDGGVRTLNAADVTAVIADNDTSAVVPAGTASVAEPAGVGTFTVRLATHPYADVEVVLSADPQCTVAGGTTTTVDIAEDDWNIEVPISVAAVDDVDLEINPHDCVVSLRAVSSDARYDGLTTTQLVAVTDDEVAEVRVTAGGPLTVAENGGTDTFHVVLASRPSADVTVTVAGDGQATASPLTFTPSTWNTTQTVTVTATDDDIDEPDPHTGTLTLGVASTAIGYGTAPAIRVDGTVSTTIALSIADDDTAGATVTPTTLDLAETGSAATYTIVLTSQPVGSVAITVTASGLCTAEPSGLEFTADNWDDVQTVTVTPGDDDIDQPGSCAIFHAATSADPNYNGLAVDEISATVANDDIAGITVTAGPSTLHEATTTTASYTVVLDTEPVDDVTITIATDGQTTVSVPTLVFTSADWDAPQTVTVSIVDDGDVETTPHSGVLTHTVASADPAYAGLLAGAVTIEIHDDETVTTVALPTSALDTDRVTTTASVTGGDVPATGTVQFAVDDTDVGPPIELQLGVAVFDLGPLPSGPHTISATYSGDALHDSSTGSGTIVVSAAPLAADDAATIAEDGVSIAIDVLANDSDPDGDELSVVTASVTQPANGTATCTTTGCTYTPRRRLQRRRLVHLRRHRRNRRCDGDGARHRHGGQRRSRPRRAGGDRGRRCARDVRRHLRRHRRRRGRTDPRLVHATGQRTARVHHRRRVHLHRRRRFRRQRLVHLRALRRRRCPSDRVVPSSAGGRPPPPPSSPGR